MAIDPGKTFKTARKISFSDATKTFKDAVGRADRFDVYRFQLSRSSSFNLNLQGLKADANVTLLNVAGKAIAQSQNLGKTSEAIYTTLEAGTYFVKIGYGQRKGDTRYQLKLSTANQTPIVASNNGLSVGRGASATITNRFLGVTDLQQNAGQLVYTLKELPQNGRLRLGGKLLKVGSTFTQVDIDSDRLSYTPIGKVQLTNNKLTDIGIHVDGSNVTWAGFDGNDYEIFLYNIPTDTVTQLTNNTVNDSAAKISGANIAWNQYDGNDSEIIFYNTATGITTQITNNDVRDEGVKISGANLAWTRTENDPGSPPELMFYNGTTGATIQLTNGGYPTDTFQMSGSNVTWIAYDNSEVADAEVFFFNGTTTRQLTNDDLEQYYPQISGNTIVWNGFDDADTEIFLFDGTTTRQLTNNNTSDFYAYVSGNNIAWSSMVNGKQDVFFYDGTTTTQITNDNINQSLSGISGSNLVWQYDSTYENTGIFFYNGATTTQLVDIGLRNGYGNISGNNAVWNDLDDVVGDGLKEGEVFLFNGARSDRFTFTVADGFGGEINGEFNVSIS